MGCIERDDDGQETPRQSYAEDTDEEMADRRAQSQVPSVGTQQAPSPTADKLLPRRELPFNRRSNLGGGGQAVPQSAKDDEDEDTEEEL